MKKSGWMIALLMFGCLLTVGCHKEESYDMQIYYLNSEETALNTEGYNLKSDKAEDYNILDAASEALLQAAVVQTVTQIDGVERVQFHVADEVLKDHHGDEVGYLRSEDFVQK